MASERRRRLEQVRTGVGTNPIPEIEPTQSWLEITKVREIRQYSVRLQKVLETVEESTITYSCSAQGARRSHHGTGYAPKSHEKTRRRLLSAE
jgi:hypothetical protein